MPYTIGLDYGTNSVRGLLVDVATGREIAAAVYDYPTGDKGIILDPHDHNMARQNPGDYLKGIEIAISAVLDQAQLKHPGFEIEQVIGIGIDTTGSTPLPVDQNGEPLAFQEKFRDNPNAQAWLWKDQRIPILPSAAAFTPPNGTGRRSPTACAPRPTSRGPRPRGLSSPITSPRTSPAIFIPPNSPAAFAPPATRRCTPRSGVACHPRRF